MPKKSHELTAADLGKLSNDDRMAVMRMVADGEITVEEAMAKVLGETNRGKDMTLSKKVTGLFGKKGATAAAGGIKGRRGAIRKNRGRLSIECMVQKASAFSVLVLKLVEGRDLLPMHKDGSADPFVKLYLSPDPNKDSKKKTAVRKHTLNPNWQEQFTWEIRTGTNLENMRLHLAVYDHALLRSNKFMGSMSFSLAEIWDEDTPSTGWFKLLDQKKGEFQNQPHRVKRRVPQPEPTKASAPAKRPLPATPVSATAAKFEAPAKRAPAKTKTVAKLNSSSFNYLKVLGQGSFGKVLLAELKDSDEVFAIKVLKKEVVVEDDDVDCTMTERRVLALGSGCHFLTSIFATFQTLDRLYFVMEFISGGDLMFHIQKLKRFSLAQATFYTAEICVGLWYLHKNGILYRDLKLDNVMLDHEGHIKIADFGMCKENIWGAATTTTFCGTPGYLAPEIVQEVPYGASVDWWSLGVLTYEMLVGDSPFEGEDEEELFDQILKHPVDYPKSLPPVAKSFICGLLEREPGRRLGSGRNGEGDIQRHPFFATIDWGKIEKREVKPPYAPTIKNKREVSNFDSEFTDEDPTLSPPDQDAIDQMDQALFTGFSFVNNRMAKDIKGMDTTEEEEDPGDSRQPSLADFSWYRPDLPRQEAERVLRGKDPGTFFVRESASQPGCYAITMSRDSSTSWNGLVTPSVTAQGTTLYKLFVKHKFDSLPELIDYYCEHPVATDSKGRKLKLVKP